MMEDRFQTKRAWVEIDTQAIQHNHEQVKHRLPEGTKMMAVVKADAYGHGALEVAGLLADRADAFGVATAWEAAELRRNGIENDILILGGTDQGFFPLLVELDVMPALFDMASAEALSEAAEGRKAGFFLAVDTGMTRIGVPDNEEGAALARRMLSLPNVELRGIFSHYACADEADKTSAEEQARRFAAFAERLRAEGVEIPCLTVSNSAGIMEMDTCYHMVREGIVLYGAYPSDEVDKSRLHLRPALSLRTRVEMVKTVPAGVGVSYGHTFVTEKESRIATLCIGYADG
ncbi:MAG: alanine racemase, partial [Clostridia bacterium]|nr:alanine racemase [Clostridia bacterium]